MTDDIRALAELLKAAIVEDRSLLGRRDDLINKIEPDVTGGQQRYYRTLKQAIMDFNASEKLFSVDHGTEEEKEAAKQAVIEVLQAANIQEKRAQCVVDILVEAMGWNDEPEVEPESEPEIIEDFADESSAQEVVVEEEEQKKEEPELWQCTACGHPGNAGAFCVECGAKRLVPGSWECPACGQVGNEDEFCVNCGHRRGTPVLQQPQRPAPQPVYQQPMQAAASPSPTVPAGQQGSGAIGKVLAGIAVVLVLIIGCFVIKDSSAKTEQSVKQTTTQTKKSGEAASVAKRDMVSDLSLGGLDLGLTIDDMHQLLGKEIKTEDLDTPGYKRYYYKDMWVVIHDGRVSALESDTDKVKTKRGLCQGAKLSAVIDTYGSNYTLSEYGGKNLYEYTFQSMDGREGILRFAVNQGTDVVNYITVRYAPSKPAAPDPVGAVSAMKAYHTAITNHQYQAAYSMLTSDMQNTMGTFENYSAGYRTTLSSTATDVKVLSAAGNTVQLEFGLRARDRAAGGRVLVQLFSGTATVVNDNGKWLIDSMQVKKQGEHYE